MCSARKSDTPKVPFRAMRLPGKLQISARTLTLVQQGQLSDLALFLKHLGGSRLPPSSAGIVFTDLSACGSPR
eukprot:IDg21632t1